MRIITVIVAMVTGLIVLLGYFFPIGIMLEIRKLLVGWAVILAAMAILVGVFNLLEVHWQKIRTKQKGGAYSILLIVSLFASVVIGAAVGTNSPTLRFFLEAIIIPAEAALLALLSVTLIYATTRLLRRQVDVMSFIFLGAALIYLLAVTPFPFGKLPFLSDLTPWLTQVFALAGARGILVGISLGALMTGIRVLFGVDRPYGGN